METNQVLRFILELQKEQATQIQQMYGWLIAIAETISADAEAESRLKQHAFYDQPPMPSPREVGVLTRNIDALIAQLP